MASGTLTGKLRLQSGDRPQRLSLQSACGVLRPALSRVAMDASAVVISSSLSACHADYVPLHRSTTCAVLQAG